MSLLFCKKSRFAYLFLFCLSLDAYAQPLATLLEPDGQVEWRKSGTTQWETLSAGCLLRKNDRVRTFADSSACILTNSCKVVKIGGNWSYTVESPSSAKPAESNLWERLIRSIPEGSSNILALRDTQSAEVPAWTAQEPIVKDIKLLGKEILLSWPASPHKPTCSVTVTGAHDKVLWSTITENAWSHLDADNSPARRGASFSWHVVPAEGAQGQEFRGTVLMLSRSNAKELTAQLAEELVAMGSPEREPAASFHSVLFYLRNGLLLEANREAQRTLRLAGEQPLYTVLLRQVLGLPVDGFEMEGNTEQVANPPTTGSSENR